MLKLVICVLSLLALPIIASADDLSSASTDDLSDAIHQSISDSIAITADYLDDFFTDERRNAEGSKSQVVISYVNTFDKDEPLTYQFFIDARLRLPKTEEKFQLLIRNAINFQSEEQESPFQDQTAQATDTGGYSAALQYIFTESRFWQVSTRAGLKFGIPLDPFAKFRIRRLIQFGAVDTRIVEEFYWGEVDRFIETSTVEFERLFSEMLFSRLRFSIQWGEQDRQWAYINDLSFFQKLKSSVVIKYTAGYQGEISNGFQLRRVFINLRYRQSFYKKWMFYELVPEFFRDDTDWNKTRFQFLMKLDLVFGKVLK